ncbi:hypothetical protein [uncultured Draconibacterium sp.]|mgnify:CR=1 FL=1|uniref:hypothetical protein n=1 Tax=uncultured Draconibacterium sp. TaxID=1573823 RepID=UPI002627866A|nr:hypothetical protein [uncultured Draconibacterium sp.]
MEQTWKKYFDDANDYSKAAIGSFGKMKFGSQVVYNLISMAIENYLTALCISSGEMPEHEGISYMLRQVAKNIEIPEPFHQEARFMNRFMNYCSLEVQEQKDPTHEELSRMIGFMGDLKSFCEGLLLKGQTV